MEEACRLSAELEESATPNVGSSAAANELEAAFRERVKYVATLDDAYQEARRAIETLPKSGTPLCPATEATGSSTLPSRLKHAG